MSIQEDILDEIAYLKETIPRDQEEIDTFENLPHTCSFLKGVVSRKQTNLIWLKKIYIRHYGEQDLVDNNL